MKPNFALSLSVEGISLLIRGDEGWARVGEVSLESPSLADDLARLRRKAAELSSEPLRTKLVIPNDQIRYLQVETDTGDEETTAKVVRNALDGATPYAVDELEYDTAAADGAIFVAAVARETLSEAETFADEHGFNPVTFVAIPEENAFPGEPYFGTSRAASSLLSAAETVEPDDAVIVITGDAEKAAARIQAQKTDVAAQAAGFAEDPAPATAFSTRRRKDRPAHQGGSAPAPARPESSDGVNRSEPDPEMDRRPGTSHQRSEAASQAQMPARTGSADLTAEAAAASDSIAAPRRDPAPKKGGFDARQMPGTGEKSRHPGLVLTAFLLLVLAAIAAFAALYLDDPISRWFGAPEETEFALEDDQSVGSTISDVALGSDPSNGVDQPSSEQGNSSSPMLADIVDPVPPPPPNVPSGTELERSELAMPLAEDGAPQRAEPGLTATDEAVLDVLRDASEPSESAVGEVSSEINAAQQSPMAPDMPSIVGLGDLYVASIDRTDLFQDAVALPDGAALKTDLTPDIVTSPAAAGTVFALDERGLVAPTAEGTPNPDGVLVFLGRPPVVPPATPQRSEIEPEDDQARDLLAGFRPRLRPTDLAERVERTALGGLTRSELNVKRPRLRPENAQTETERVEEPTALAIVRSRTPLLRPADLATRIAQRPSQSEAEAEADGEPETQPVATIAAAPSAPRIPSSASVARQATIDNAINLRRLNLIGVYGTPSNRRALLRLPSGRYKKVKVGDTVDGGRVLAIGDNELRYQKGGRNHTLKIPNG